MTPRMGRLRIGVPVVLVVAAVGCAPAPATAEGRDIETLYRVAQTIAMAIVALVWLLALFAIVRFRRPSATDEPEQRHGSTRLEIAWTVVPVVIVLGLFAGTLAVLARTEARSPQVAAEVEVEAFRWGWTIRYPATGIEVTGIGLDGPEAVVPFGAPVRFTLRSPDVVHSFYVPLFLFKRDVIPGEENVFEVTIEEAGVYGGQCAEYCGIGHAAMPFTVRAVSPEEYAAWLAAGGSPSPGWASPGSSSGPAPAGPESPAGT